MPRAKHNDLAEIFGYAPDDTSPAALKQWKSGLCPFTGGICIKHSHPQANGKMTIYGSCSVVNQTRNGKEEVIICPNRLYAENYRALKTVAEDAIGHLPEVLLAHDYAVLKKKKKLPDEYLVVLGHNSGREVALSNPGVIQLSLDWVMVLVSKGKPKLVIPCEVQSIDITGNYFANWEAYKNKRATIPDSKHGMNYANVWKRLIPQLILKSSVATTSELCQKGMYFIIPERVYKQFEKIVGAVKPIAKPGHGVLSVMTYELGPEVAPGKIRSLEHSRTSRVMATDFAAAFAAGKQLPLGTQLDKKVAQILDEL